MYQMNLVSSSVAYKTALANSVELPVFTYQYNKMIFYIK